MTRPAIARPAANEHADWAITYMNDTATALSDAKLSDVRDLLEAQPTQLDALLASVTEANSATGYAPGKWTIKESLIHMADVERVFAYRMLRIARADRTPLPGFEHNDWVPESRSNERALNAIVHELKTVRSASLVLVNSLDETAIGQVGTVNGNSFTPRALTWMFSGHMAHHLFLLRDKYLPVLAQ